MKIPGKASSCGVRPAGHRNRIKRKGSILSDVLESASSLHTAGLISDETMDEFKELCVSSRVRPMRSKAESIKG